MSRRYLSPYYASIGKARALRALFGWAAGCVVSARRRREQLAQVVRGYCADVDVFALGSARSALAACLKAAGVGPEDEVLLSSYTCLAVATAVVAAGAKPVYLDIDPVTLNVTGKSVEAALTPRVKAVIVQHTLGKVAPIAEICHKLRAHGVLVIEDCALAVGSTLAGRAVGSTGDAAIFSMELSKTLSCGWGGILVVRDRSLAVSMKRFYESLPERGWWAATRDIWQTAISAWCHQPSLYQWLGRYVLFAGFQSRTFRSSTPKDEYDGRVAADFMEKLPGASCGLASLQWRDLREIAAACAANARQIRRVLDELHIVHPGSPCAEEYAVAPRVSFLVANRSAASDYFLARGVELGEWFDGPMSPVPTAPQFNYRSGGYPNAEHIARHVVNLPCHSRMTAKDVDHVCNTLRSFVQDCPECPIRH